MRVSKLTWARGAEVEGLKESVADGESGDGEDGESEDGDGGAGAAEGEEGGGSRPRTVSAALDSSCRGSGGREAGKGCAAKW